MAKSIRSLPTLATGHRRGKTCFTQTNLHWDGCSLCRRRRTWTYRSAICGRFRSPSTAARTIVRKPVASFLEIAVAPEVDGVSTHIELARHLARGEAVGEAKHHPASQHRTLWGGSRSSPSFEPGPIARAEGQRSVAHESGHSLDALFVDKRAQESQRCQERLTTAAAASRSQKKYSCAETFGRPEHTRSRKNLREPHVLTHSRWAHEAGTCRRRSTSMKQSVR